MALYESYLDGLFTYCLSVLCEQDAATFALGDALAIAERCRGRLRDPALLRPWLYALARYAGQRRLAAAEQPSAGARRSGSSPALDPAAPGSAWLPSFGLWRHSRELAALAWPEAAGTTPQQRESLELAVRHGLPPREVALVLGLEMADTRELLARAACEVERTRVALAVLEMGNCPALAAAATAIAPPATGAAGDPPPGTKLRRGPARHLDDCPKCRKDARRVAAKAERPPSGTPAVLALVEAPRSAVRIAMIRSDFGGRRPSQLPRLDRNGFPVRAVAKGGRGAVLRQRAVTTTLVAAVAVAPVVTLWAAFRDGLTEPGVPGVPVSTADADTAQRAAGPGETGAPAADSLPVPHPAAQGHPTDTAKAAPTGSAAGADRTASPAAGSPDSMPSGADGAGPQPRTAAGRLTAAARSQGNDTVITLTASGGAPVHWTATPSASWLRLDRTSGVLQPGQSTTITVSVDEQRQPAGEWTAKVTINPSGSVVTIKGRGPTPGPSEPQPSADGAGAGSAAAEPYLTTYDPDELP